MGKINFDFILIDLWLIILKSINIIKESQIPELTEEDTPMI